jgi:hypothetical protein
MATWLATAGPRKETMTTTLTLPPPEQLVAEIRVRREELAALKKLLRAAKHAAEAARARQQREALVEARAGHGTGPTTSK